MANYLVTGCAGFIGSAVSMALLKRGDRVFGVDELNDYYSPKLKKWRLHQLYYQADNTSQFLFANDLSLITFGMRRIKESFPADAILHFAAYPGVRRSMEDPELYVRNNVIDSIRVLKAAKEFGIPRVFMASSSSVYGDNATLPDRDTIEPVHEMFLPLYQLSPYSASKRMMEHLASIYADTYDMNITVARYFTVYGPAGRPDMAYLKFIDQISRGEAITVYGDGEQRRDMTYISDAVEATLKMIGLDGFNVINIGTGYPVSLNKVISIIGCSLDICPQIEHEPAQPGESRVTCASIERAETLLGWKPTVRIEEGIERTVEWYNEVGKDLLREE